VIDGEVTITSGQPIVRFEEKRRRADQRAEPISSHARRPAKIA
jgi:hypothetical protein